MRNLPRLRLIQIDGTEDLHALEADLGPVTPRVTLGTTVPRSSFLMSLHLLPGPVEDPGAILFFFFCWRPRSLLFLI